MALIPSISEEFNKRFAAWLRIEPRCRQDNFAQGLQARTADPLWMLARQWQTGEFRGEDAGSPIDVSLTYSTQSVDQIKLGDASAKVNPAGIPLETLVEQETGLLNYRERVRIGQEFEQRLKQLMENNEYSTAEIKEFLLKLRSDETLGFPVALPPLHMLDRATQKFIRFMQGQVIDGKAVLENSTLVSNPLPLTDMELDSIRHEVLVWYGKVCNRPVSNLSPAWQPESLDYSFETNAYPDLAITVPDVEQKTRLVANDYRNGTVDWYTFSAGAEGARNWQNTAQIFKSDIITPTRIEVSGTSRRWWAFEDGNTDFGDMDVAKPDLAKLLLMEFVLIYGDDWFSVPAPVALGSLVKVDKLRVLNVFGDRTFVLPARKITGTPAERFDLFTITPVADPIAPGIAEADRPLLFVPPVAGFRQESAPLDEVRFLRDEGANMIWGVEQVVPNGRGRPIAGFDAQLERLERANEVERSGLELLIKEVGHQLENAALTDVERAQIQKLAHLATARLEELNPHATPTPSQKDIPRFRLATSVPENWIPFIPVQRNDSTIGAHTGIEFRRAQMLRNTDHARLDSEMLTEEFVKAAASGLGLPENIFIWMSEQNAGSDYVPSMSRLLALDEDALLWLNEEAVPRAGLRVQLTKQRTRWTDGSTHVWLGRKVLTGRGEGSSGLKFDYLKA